ncbi:MAG TPA: GNAT family N-acetyltransferase [Acidimicrobiales bacterium]|nr:GNAT family N-acetyltransferase [Acidimicrobiales bacterium]
MSDAVSFEWRGAVEELELDWLHAEAFDHPPVPAEWQRQLEQHSLGWVCAREQDELVGFVKVLWDGGNHAFIIDAAVLPNSQRQGVGTGLVQSAAEHAREAGATWLHADFARDIAGFFLERCGFTPTEGGRRNLREALSEEGEPPEPPQEQPAEVQVDEPSEQA